MLGVGCVHELLAGLATDVEAPIGLGRAFRDNEMVPIGLEVGLNHIDELRLVTLVVVSEERAPQMRNPTMDFLQGLYLVAICSRVSGGEADIFVNAILCAHGGCGFSVCDRRATRRRPWPRRRPRRRGTGSGS